MELRNLTPDEIVIHLASGEALRYPSVGNAKVSTLFRPMTRVYVSEFSNPIPILPAVAYGPVEGLPEPKEGVAYIVSATVLDALRGSGRTDVFTTGTGKNDGAVRNEKGRIIGVSALIACG